MFFLVGIGLKAGHLTQEAVQILKQCDNVFLEAYTSKFSEGSVKDFEELIERKVTVLERRQVEEKSKELLSTAKKNKIALCVFGNALTATTHVQLLIEAREMRIKFQFLPGISITSFLGFTGLDAYKFGRIITIVRPQEGFAPQSFHAQILKNKKANLHSLCLLDVKESGEMIGVKEALQILQVIENQKVKKQQFLEESVLVGIAGAGNEKMQVKAGSLRELNAFDFSLFPQSLIVCGKLSEKEKEALQALSAFKG